MDALTCRLGGDLAAIRTSAVGWSAFGAKTSEAAADIRSIDSGDFQGDEADSYRDLLNRDLPPHLDTTAAAWSDVAGALQTYAGELEGLQTRISTLVGQADQQQAARDRADDAVAVAQTDDRIHTASAEATTSSSGQLSTSDLYDPKLPRATAELANAQAALQVTIDAANRLRAEHDAAVDSCVGAINRAATMRFQEPPGFWGRLKDSVVTWVSDHADVLKAVSAVLKQISSIAGVLAMIPVLAPVMAPLAVAAGAGSVLIDGAVKLATGEGSWADVLIDGATMLPLGKGLALFKDARASVSGGAKLTERVAADGKRAGGSVSSDVAGGAGSGPGHPVVTVKGPPTRAVDSPASAVRTKTPLDRRSCASDPIDVVSGEMILLQTDLALPGVLPLVLKRVHLSSYRWGRSFGPSWASTVDQRVEIGGDSGACFVAEDGVVLYYPGAESAVAGVRMLPSEGPARWPLCRSAGGGWTVEDPDTGVVRRFAAPDRDGSAVIVEISDRNGNFIAFDYDDRGIVCAVRHSGGYRVDLPSVDGLITGVVVRDGETVVTVCSFEYRDRNLVVSRDASGRPLNLEYDQDARITGWIDRNEIGYRYQYDDEGRCVRTSGRGRVLSYGFSYLPGRTLVTDSLGAVSTYEFDEQLQITRVVDPLGGATTSTWDCFDRLQVRVDALGRRTTFEYDEAGRLGGVTRPNATRELLHRNTMGLPIRVVDADGAEWTHTYDARGNRTSLVDPCGSLTRYTYDATGAVRTVTDALGGVTAVAVNGAGLPIEIVDPAGARTTCDYDGLGRVVRTVDPVGGATTLSWTADGRPSRRVGPDGAQEEWDWDGEGNLTAHVDPGGARTTIDNGLFDLPTARTTPDGGCFRFSYDTELRLTEVLNPVGLRWLYVYDAAGRLTAETDFNGHRQTYVRDQVGQLMSITNALGQTTRLRYDVVGRVVERRSPDGSTAFSYDAAGRVLSARSPGATVEFGRDKLGRTVSETVNGRTVRWDFDALGRRSAMTTPAGVSSQWAFGAAGQPSRLTCADQSIRFVFDAAGRETARIFSGGGQLSRSYDGMGRLATQMMGTQSQIFTYRPGGAVTSVTSDDSGSRRFDLDASGRVTGVHALDWTESYVYDASGNVTSGRVGKRPKAGDLSGLGAEGWVRAYSGTLVRRSGDVSYQHDGQGRMVVRSRKRISRKPEVWHFAYDCNDRMVAAASAEARWSYAYDAFGRRISKERVDDNGLVVERVDFSWDGDRLIEQARTVGAGLNETTTWGYLPGSWTPISQVVSRAVGDAEDGEFYAIVSDMIGKPTELMTPDGSRVAWGDGESTLWGAPRRGAKSPSNSSTRYDVDCPIRFPGQYADDETGLRYNRHRYYDPESGRYTTRDPLGLAPAPDPHAYVPNPTVWADPLGLTPCDPANLQWDEANGGHTIARHVGKSIEYLRGRRIEVASTFPNLSVASTETASNLTQNQGAVRWWLLNSRSKVIVVSGDLSPGAGLSYLSRTDETVESRMIRSVLVRRPGGPGGLHVFTSYPRP